jgi:hypothetical protein
MRIVCQVLHPVSGSANEDGTADLLGVECARDLFPFREGTTRVLSLFLAAAQYRRNILDQSPAMVEAPSDAPWGHLATEDGKVRPHKLHP